MYIFPPAEILSNEAKALLCISFFLHFFLFTLFLGPMHVLNPYLHILHSFL